MPIITEEDEENGSQSETGTDEVLSNWERKLCLEH